MIRKKEEKSNTNKTEYERDDGDEQKVEEDEKGNLIRRRIRAIT